MVFSVILLAFEAPASAGPRAAQARADGAARSLASLVEACVRGLAADAVLAGPPGAGLERVADDAGCSFIETPEARSGMAQALATARQEHVFVLRAGFAVERGFVEEVADVFAYGDAPGALILRAAPDSLVTRIAPSLSAPVGVIARKRALVSAGAFELPALARRLKGAELKARARKAI